MGSFQQRVLFDWRGSWVYIWNDLVRLKTSKQLYKRCIIHSFQRLGKLKRLMENQNQRVTWFFYIITDARYYKWRTKIYGYTPVNKNFTVSPFQAIKFEKKNSIFHATLYQFLTLSDLGKKLKNGDAHLKNQYRYQKWLDLYNQEILFVNYYNLLTYLLG